MIHLNNKKKFQIWSKEKSTTLLTEIKITQSMYLFTLTYESVLSSLFKQSSTLTEPISCDKVIY